MAIYLGTVTSVNDDLDGGRIKVYIPSVDNSIPDPNDYPWVFPLMPKFFQSKPKEGECVLIFTQDDGNPRSQRFYIGPIISQPQLMYESKFTDGATSMLDGGPNLQRPAISTITNTNGTQPNDDDIAILGRKNCDIIISDDSIEMRSGAKVVDENDKEKFEFNRNDPAYIKLKYHEHTIEGNDDDEGRCASSAIISADYINLLSPNGDPALKKAEDNRMLSDDEITRLIQEAHSLPYGDVLVDILVSIIRMFKNHVHPFALRKPCADIESGVFDEKYGTLGEKIEEKMLSTRIRIN